MQAYSINTLFKDFHSFIKVFLQEINVKLFVLKLLITVILSFIQISILAKAKAASCDELILSDIEGKKKKYIKHRNRFYIYAKEEEGTGSLKTVIIHYYNGPLINYLYCISL